MELRVGKCIFVYSFLLENAFDKYISKPEFVYLKWYRKHANDDIGQSQVRDKQIGDGLHLPSRCNYPYDQGVANHRQDTDGSVEHRQ